MEHLAFEEGEKILTEFRRCLKKGGVLRIAMPGLYWIIIEQYGNDFKNEDWFPGGYESVQTKRMATNMAFYWWGHKYLYNEDDLRNHLIKAGLQKIKRCEWSRSDYPEPSNLEARKQSILIMEAEKE